MMKLFAGMSQDPDMAACLTVLEQAATLDDMLTPSACDCIVKITPDKFIAWTGVDMWSCGMGSGFYAAEERDHCKNMGRFKWL